MGRMASSLPSSILTSVQSVAIPGGQFAHERWRRGPCPGRKRPEAGWQDHSPSRSWQRPPHGRPSYRVRGRHCPPHKLYPHHILPSSAAMAFNAGTAQDGADFLTQLIRQFPGRAGQLKADLSSRRHLSVLLLSIHLLPFSYSSVIIDNLDNLRLFPAAASPAPAAFPSGRIVRADDLSRRSCRRRYELGNLGLRGAGHAEGGGILHINGLLLGLHDAGQGRIAGFVQSLGAP